LLPALTMQVVEGSFTGRRFCKFIAGLLDEMDRCMPVGSVIVMDNARIHKDRHTLSMIKARSVNNLCSLISG
ncbi:hypothetical protein C8J56DRAFT_773756, partial [Mycena floridula]